MWNETSSKCRALAVKNLTINLHLLPSFIKSQKLLYYELCYFYFSSHINCKLLAHSAQSNLAVSIHIPISFLLGLHRIVNLPDIRPPDIRFFFYRIPDIRPRYPATGYPVMAGYPAKSALKIKFLPEFRAFNYQIHESSIRRHINILQYSKNRKNSESTQNGLNWEILKKIYLPPPTKIQ